MQELRGRVDRSDVAPECYGRRRCGEGSLREKGASSLDKQDYDAAISAFTEAIRLDPECAVAYSNRGIAFENKGEHDSAIADFTNCIRLDPKDATAYYSRGSAYSGSASMTRPSPIAAKPFGSA